MENLRRQIIKYIENLEELKGFKCEEIIKPTNDYNAKIEWLKVPFIVKYIKNDKSLEDNYQ